MLEAMRLPMALLAAHTAGQIERVNGATTGPESGREPLCNEAPDPLAAYFLPENDRRGTDFVSVFDGGRLGGDGHMRRTAGRCKRAAA